MELYETLGVPKEASKKKIKEAYRRLSKKFHPDVKGDPERFKEISHAYGVLYDDQRRKVYDEQGYQGEPNELTRDAQGALQQIFYDILKNLGPEQMIKTDVLANIKSFLEATLDKTKKEIQREEKILGQHKEVAFRIKHEGTEDNMFGPVVAQEILKHTEILKKLRHTEIVVSRAQEILKHYGFRFDQLPQNWAPVSAVYTTTSRVAS